MKSNNKNILSNVVSCGRLFATLMLILNSRMVLAVAESGATADTVQASSFDVSYFVPGNNIETGTKIKAEKKEEDVSIYYSLGGMRLRFAYSPSPAEAPVISNMRWELGSDTAETKGKICSSFKIDSCSNEVKPKHFLEANPSENAKIKAVFWEPEEWLVTNALTAKLVVEFNDPVNPDRVPMEKNFKVTSRLLKPVTDKPMKGSDVGMLEDIFWHLGISPQKGSYGSLGARIASNRSASARGPINTESCFDGVAKHRDTYYRGTEAECAANRVSTELMINRFQGRSRGFVNNRFDRNVEWTNHQTGNGQVNDQMLSWLEDDWKSYMTAYKQFAGQGRVDKNHPSVTQWLDNAVAIWQGGLAPYVPVTYTQIRHEGVLESSGLSKTAFSRQHFLNIWALRESTGHWGTSPYHKTDYRLDEGAADPFGSLSFSQLLYAYRYSDKPSVIHETLGKNLYHPAENLETFVIHTAKNTDPTVANHVVVGKGGFNRAFATDSTLGEPIPGDLVGYMKNNALQTLTANSTEGDYELLAKAVGIYNGATGWLRANSWPFIMKTYKVSPAGSSVNVGNTDKTKRICYSCKYSIQVRAKAGFGYRGYVWHGDDAIPDNPATTDVDESQPAWCFKYGEKEWVDGKRFKKVYEAARGDLLAAPPVAPVGRLNCTTGVSIP